MISEINKFSLNWILSIVAPGGSLILFIGWGFGIYYSKSLDLIKEYEIFSVFIFLLFAFIIGILIDSVSQQIESRAYRNQRKTPRLKVLEKNPHWLDDLDIYYFNYLGIHLYDWDKKENQAKAGNVNGKKINNFNLSQFEHFANYVLSKESVSGKLENERSKYLLCRNLAYSFRVCAGIGLLYSVTGMGFTFMVISPENIFHNSYFCLMVSALLLVISFYLSYIYKIFRLNYLTMLYRFIRFHYLIMLKPKQHSHEK